MCYDNKEMRDLMKSVREITTYKWINKDDLDDYWY